MLQDKKVRISCRGVIIHEDKMLLQNIKDRDYWNNPGGGYEGFDNSFEDCVVREIREETGMDVTVEKLLFVQDLFADKVTQVELFFLAHPVDMSQYNEFHIDPDAPDNKNRLKWFSFEELDTIKVLPTFLIENFEQLLHNKTPIHTKYN